MRGEAALYGPEEADALEQRTLRYAHQHRFAIHQDVFLFIVFWLVNLYDLFPKYIFVSVFGRCRGSASGKEFRTPETC
jgi:hypothetical protein